MYLSAMAREKDMGTQWIILDMMGVIFEVGDDVNDLLIPYVQKRNRAISAQEIYEMYLSASLGEISSFDFWNELGFSTKYPEIERDYLNSCLRIDPEFKGVAEKLTKDYSLAVLSNDMKEWSDYLRAKFELNELFKAIIISGEVGCRKPDKRIYNILLARIQAPPADCVLIDDSLKNLRSASEIGIKTIKFTREESSDTFSPDFQISCFAELPQAVKKVFE